MSLSILQIDIFIAQQFLFQRQWQRVRRYAKKLGIKIMGDMPIYVGYHSADVWANKKLFLMVCVLHEIWRLSTVFDLSFQKYYDIASSCFICVAG